jgi:hypothetical protein
MALNTEASIRCSIEQQAGKGEFAVGVFVVIATFRIQIKTG